MENLTITVNSAPQARRQAAVLVGVVASGNCEVLLEPQDSVEGRELCTFTVHTSALGFAPIWQAVIADFAERRCIGGLLVEINDAGASPAVVGLRLDQAIEVWENPDA
jgi:malonate decarboxylase delta subunit